MRWEKAGGGSEREMSGGVGGGKGGAAGDLHTGEKSKRRNQGGKERCASHVIFGGLEFGV